MQARGLLRRIAQMNLTMRWVGYDERPRVALAREQCYAMAGKEHDRYLELIDSDDRARPGDYLLAEHEGGAVGTATSYSMSMWVRGGRIPCQAVAWVGAVKTHRRRGGAGDGVASQVVRELLRMARERQETVSALMPFRGSFYEHFGYGIVERQCVWTVPLAVLPAGPFHGIDFMQAADLPALAAVRQRHVQRGQCDIERSPASWSVHLKKWEDGQVVVDKTPEGAIRGYLAFRHAQRFDKDYAMATEIGYDDPASFRRLLHFLESLRDQYGFATLTLPADLPFNRLLRETQAPHRPVNHPHAEMRWNTRMQVRVLDHAKLVEAMRFPAERSGRAVVSVQETEGHESRFSLDISQGRASAAPSAASPDLECTDRTWAAIITGDLPVATAMQWGLATVRNERAVEALSVLSHGPAPFCQEYF